MSDPQEWSIGASAQPKPEDVTFDLDEALASIVAIRTEIPPDAFTASILGTERSGNGVIISGDGLVLTVGYLIAEAETVWIFTGDGQAVAGHVLAYDHDTGFGLVHALGKLGPGPLPIGNSGSARVDDDVVVGGYGGRQRSLRATIVGVREFAGYWEYLLDKAIFTAPAHPNWGGTGLIGADGRLLGIGSLFVQQTRGGEDPVDCNMIIPIDLLKPVLDDLMKYGRRNAPPRPWLGIYTAEADDNVVIAGVVDGGPADAADLRVADVILEVGDQPVMGQASLLRKIWATGEAGVEVPLTLLRDGERRQVPVRSSNRADYLKSPQLH